MSALPLNVGSPNELHDDFYLRERAAPQPGDPIYLHLSDLRLALERCLPPPSLRVLDYGCGGSPYRAAFRTAHYHRADLPGQPALDYLLGPDNMIGAADASYDVVLSTQVLEHVRHPTTYLKECRRLLCPNGRLILSTHGLFPDHACPFDFRRWTADGLMAELSEAGLHASQVFKLTTGPRALVFFNQQYTGCLLPRGNGLTTLAVRASRLLYSRFPRSWLDRWCDTQWKEYRAVPAETPGHALYVGLLAVAHPGP